MASTTERADARGNRARILTAAIALFAERGIDAEMREIAERAGIAVGTVYNHFPSKEDLLIAVVNEAVSEMEQLSERVEAEPDVVTMIRVYLHDGLTVAERYGAVLAAMTESRILATRKEIVDESRRAALGDRIRNMIRRGVTDGVFRPDLDIDVAAVTLWSVFLPWTLTELRRTRTPDQIAESLLAIFLDGARP